MAHLVAPQLEPFDLARYTEELQQAHDFLAKNGADSVARACGIKCLRDWGSALKRVRVTLPNENRPELVAGEIGDHNLAEVMNQCATLERLIDALGWCVSEASGFKKFRGVRCHPTTSSSDDPDESSDNDLVLVGPNGHFARFEVSDVASGKDGNCKEGKDLASLGVLRQIKRGRFTFEETFWPVDQRLFLVVSSEFADRLERPSRSWLKGKTPHCHYIQRLSEGATRIFEVCKGPPHGAAAC